MSQIAVFHPNLRSMGGGERVCAEVLEALDDVHDVTLFTLKNPGLSKINEFYDTEISNININTVGVLGTVMNSFDTVVEDLTGRSTIILQRALLKRIVDEFDFDLIISTNGEFSFHTPAVQYIHYPHAARLRDGSALGYYDRFCHTIEGYNEDVINNTVLLANSKWTARKISEYYDSNPEVVYPPVNTDAFHTSSWSEKEPGFVSIGRLIPEKNIRRNIEIIKKLRKEGYDVHLHIVGTINKHHRAYGQEIRQLCDQVDYLIFEGELSRDELIRLISKHRYGIHGREPEHFGIVVAEFVAGGALPFVPNCGGQSEIIGGQSELLYNSPREAVSKISFLIENEEKAEEVRQKIPDVKENFGRDRFRQKITQIVEHKLNSL